MPFPAPRQPRFTIDRSGRNDVIRIEPMRPIYALLLFPIWLVIWTFGGIEAIKLVQLHPDPLLYVWLCAWLLGWLYAAGLLVWMLLGSETVSVINRDLEIGRKIGPFTFRKLYKGTQVRDLQVSLDRATYYESLRWNGYWSRRKHTGAIQFTHGSRRVRFASSLDDAEAALVIDWIAKQLPGTGVKK